MDARVVLGVGLGILGVTLAALYLTREEAVEEEEELPELLPEEEEEGIIDAEFRSGYVYWAGLTTWQRVYTTWINEWPADTDITFAWEIKNIGTIGAYFQVYIFDPGSWFYLDPGEKVEVHEEAHTLAIPVTPGYQFARITILGRKVTGERIGAVYTSEEFEIIYV